MSGHHYTPKWQSHTDDTAVSYSPMGTARGRIARHGARMKRSRSGSQSPVSPCDGMPANLQWSPPLCTTQYNASDRSCTTSDRDRSRATDQPWMAESDSSTTEPAYRSASSDSIDTATENDTLLKGDDTPHYNSHRLNYFDTENLDNLESLQDTRV